MFTYPKIYDVVVAGAGHAGCEAALAASRMGCKTLLLTMNLDTIAQMSCNPAIGGLAKGHLVREIDALGGEMGMNTDATGIQFRMLNMKKGASVRAPRAQCDKKAYQFRMKAILERTPNLDLKQGNIADLEVEGDCVVAVATSLGVKYRTSSVVITTGTFLKALLHVGLRNAVGGRMGDGVSNFSDTLRSLGFEVQRLKTGTPPRLNGRTIDFSKCQSQEGDVPPPRFSYVADTIEKAKDDIFTLNCWKPEMFHVEQLPCWITHTNLKTAEIIRANLDKSPLYCGIIQGIGPRYCPSLEDKIVRFADKERHQIFLEPEGRHTDEYYVNGCSTSLPIETQYDFIRSIAGLEEVEIMRAGYAVEYDFCPPTQLQSTLETKKIEGLYFAGQINGTSGYEEAAAQGLMAGINAALKVQHKAPFILGRHEAYIGVLVDDLVTKGTKEPYRMFTSRAEYRLLLRQDNADLRLTQHGAQLGLASSVRVARIREKQSRIEEVKQRLSQIRVDGILLQDWLRRPDFMWSNLPEEFQSTDSEVADQVETDLKYSGYVARELGQIEKAREMEETLIPEWVDFNEIKGLKTEARIKLNEIRPRSFGQASRISGINPADVAILSIWVKRGKSASGKAASK
ncbi:MAG: tRNA uridine-5-carboxymethylaminomethyl(34) synthesis enzyme MnmG [Methylacidiphilales bacterium]|nr:tRNA uridine-5-carboxymethylaminomethyl(34) synthesis enzyme MnmG [Candidatus Methylacidiphilales bacterium]